MGPQLTVLIIEVSLFQSAHNSRFDCIPGIVLCHIIVIIGTPESILNQELSLI